ncbi:MAG: hypothetical protein H7066_16565 [Cytophagaceae bacterium]|nr:hypothetical protein [Gemmatimonadaceae bacterium]
MIAASSTRGSHANPGLPFFLWAGSYVAVRVTLESERVAGGARVALALLPLPVFLWTLVALVRGVREMDELERRIQLEALSVAFPLTLVLLMTLGLVEVARPLDPGNWSFRHLWPFLLVFYAIGLLIARKRYL